MQLARNKQAQILSPEKRYVRGQESNGSFYEEGDKENQNQGNFIKNKSNNKMVHFEKQFTYDGNNQCLQQTQQTEQSRVIIDQMISEKDINFSDNSPNATNQSIIDNKVSETTNFNQQLVHQNESNCFNCDMFKLQLQKEFCRKQIEISEKHSKDKDQIRSQMNQKYSRLWENHNEQNKLVIHLQHQNRRLNYELEKYANLVENMKKIKKREIEQLLEINKKETEEMLKNIENRSMTQLTKKDKHIQDLKEQCKGLKKVIQDMGEEKQRLQQNLKQRIRQIQDNHQLMVSSLKRHYDSKLMLIDQRHSSELQTLAKEHELIEDSLIEQNNSYELIIREKDQSIEKLLRFIEQLNDTKRQQMVFEKEIRDFGQINRDLMIGMREELKKQSQFRMNEQFSYLRKLYESTAHKLKLELNLLIKENEGLRQELIRKKQIKLQFTEVISSSSHDECINQNTSLYQEKLKLIIKRNQQLYERELKIKQEELSTYQQLINSYEVHIQSLNQQLEKVEQSHAQQSSVKLIEYKQALNQLEATKTELTKLISDRDSLIKELRRRVNELESQNNKKQDLQYCDRLLCKAHLEQLTLFKEQCAKLKHILASQKYELEQCHKKLNSIKSDLQEQFQSKYQLITDSLLKQLHQTHAGTLKSTKKSYEKLLGSKNQQMEELQQIIHNLTKINYQLNSKCKLVQTDIQKLETEFYQVLTPLLLKSISQPGIYNI